MPKVVINDQGLVQKAGSGFEFEVSPIVPISTLVSSSAAPLTLSAGGMYTISGEATQIVMPLASSIPGGTIIVRSTSAYAHFLTGSQEANGTLVFAGHVGATPANQGSKLTLPAVVGSSVALVSDGKSYLMLAASGSCTISGT